MQSTHLRILWCSEGISCTVLTFLCSWTSTTSRTAHGLVQTYRSSFAILQIESLDRIERFYVRCTRDMHKSCTVYFPDLNKTPSRTGREKNVTHATSETLLIRGRFNFSQKGAGLLKFSYLITSQQNNGYILWVHIYQFIRSLLIFWHSSFIILMSSDRNKH